jgi:hypothetical protein
MICDVSPTLEERRRAIVEALRSIMAEPLPPNRVIGKMPAPQPDPSPDVEAALQPYPEADDLGPATPSVPPLKITGGMSPAASRALFGHD